MNETLNGLLIQKAPSPPPKPGEERSLSWEQKQGKSGKPYIKIKNNSQEYGGTLCTIIDAERTDFTDSHGNVSFNVGFTPKNGSTMTMEQVVKESRRLSPRQPENVDDDPLPMTHNAKGEALPAVDEAKRHLVQSANLYNLCADCVNAVIQPNIENMNSELYQAAVGTLFIEASRAGFVSKMPTTKLK